MGSLIARTKLADGKVIARDAIGYTDSMDFSRCAGDAAVLYTGSLGTATITQQCSFDNINWYDPIAAAGTALGAVCTATAASTVYISFTPVLAPFVRFKVDETNVAILTYSLTLIFREET